MINKIKNTKYFCGLYCIQVDIYLIYLSEIKKLKKNLYIIILGYYKNRGTYMFFVAIKVWSLYISRCRQSIKIKYIIYENQKL